MSSGGEVKRKGRGYVGGGEKKWKKKEREKKWYVGGGGKKKRGEGGGKCERNVFWELWKKKKKRILEEIIKNE